MFVYVVCVYEQGWVPVDLFCAYEDSWEDYKVTAVSLTALGIPPKPRIEDCDVL